MPVYVYRCQRCGSEFEKRQSFSDAPLSECERCHGALRKVFSPAAIIFKGSGFYVTDNHGKLSGDGRIGSGDKSEGSDKADKAESKPAAESKETAKSSASSAED